jgi:hypothetical protein
MKLTDIGSILIITAYNMEYEERIGVFSSN